jgi:hypothetical protein
MPRFTVTWEARPLDEFGQPMGSTVSGQEDADSQCRGQGSVSPRPPSDTGLRCLGPRADLQPAAFGEAGLWVTVVSLPARGRPPQAAARRAGLEVEEKVLTARGDGSLILKRGQSARPCGEPAPGFDVRRGRRLHPPSCHPPPGRPRGRPWVRGVGSSGYGR